jgi:hypothetical protein
VKKKLFRTPDAAMNSADGQWKSYQRWQSFLLKCVKELYLVKESSLNNLHNVVCSFMNNADLLHSWQFFVLLLPHTHTHTHIHCCRITSYSLLITRKAFWNYLTQGSDPIQVISRFWSLLATLLLVYIMRSWLICTPHPILCGW